METFAKAMRDFMNNRKLSVNIYEIDKPMSLCGQRGAYSNTPNLCPAKNVMQNTAHCSTKL